MNEATQLLPKPKEYETNNYALLFPCIISILFNVGQAVFLPLFISTFFKNSCSGGFSTGPYFILFIMSFLFNIPFLIGCVYDQYNKNDLNVQNFVKYLFPLMLMGFFDALNGILMVFSSSLDRTSGYMQSILLNLNIPFTIVLTKLILNNENTINSNCIYFVMVGILISVIPNIIELFYNKNEISMSVFPFLFVLSIVPNVLMNITQKWIFVRCPDFNKNLMLFGESIFQFVTICLCFWIDIIPMIGTSKNINQFKDNFSYGFQCFFNPIYGSHNVDTRCNYSMPIGLLFAMSYCGVYYYNSHLIHSVSVSFNSIVQIISTPIQIQIWYIIMPLTTWICGNKYTEFQMIMALLSLPFISYGSYLYHQNDKIVTVRRIKEVETINLV